MKTDEQIKGQIADTESQIQTLSQQHDRMVAQFNQAVAENQAQFQQLQGRLGTLREMLSEKPEETSKKKNSKKK